MDLPEGEAFRTAVEALRGEPGLGARLPRAEYERLIEERDREWLQSRDESSLPDRLEQRYREERVAWQA